LKVNLGLKGFSEKKRYPIKDDLQKKKCKVIMYVREQWNIRKIEGLGNLSLSLRTKASTFVKDRGG